MKDWGRVEFWPTLEGMASVIVKEPGFNEADEFKEIKSKPRRRAREVRDAFLHWLYDEHLSGGYVLGISDFLKSPKNQYLGDPYTEEELSRAVPWPPNKEYIEGIKTWGAPFTKSLQLIRSPSGSATTVGSLSWFHNCTAVAAEIRKRAACGY